MAEQFHYSSVLAPYMKHLLDTKTSAGISAHRTKWILKEFDDFANREGMEDARITEDLIKRWRATRVADCGKTLYAKYSVWSQLARGMCRQGCECFIPRLPREPKSGFTPYIFTHGQMSDIFAAADGCRLYDIRMGTALICIPAILRLLYGTGMRVSEALSIRNRDVHLDEHYIHLRKTKNGSERIVPVSESLAAVLRQYTGYRNRIPVKNVSAEDGILFVKPDGTGVSQGAVYTNFKKILGMCGIPHYGNHHGPRVHDLRHTYAVHSLVEMGRSGMDLYTCLPILSTALGHHSLAATEQYVRLTCSMYPELEERCSEINAFVYPKVCPAYDYDD